MNRRVLRRCVLHRRELRRRVLRQRVLRRCVLHRRVLHRRPVAPPARRAVRDAVCRTAHNSYSAPRRVPRDRYPLDVVRRRLQVQKTLADVPRCR